MHHLAPSLLDLQRLGVWTSALIGAAVALYLFYRAFDRLVVLVLTRALLDPPRDGDLLKRQRELSAAAVGKSEHKGIVYGPRMVRR